MKLRKRLILTILLSIHSSFGLANDGDWEKVLEDVRRGVETSENLGAYVINYSRSLKSREGIIIVRESWVKTFEDDIKLFPFLSKGDIKEGNVNIVLETDPEIRRILGLVKEKLSEVEKSRIILLIEEPNAIESSLLQSTLNAPGVVDSLRAKIVAKILEAETDMEILDLVKYQGEVSGWPVPERKLSSILWNEYEANSKENSLALLSLDQVSFISPSVWMEMKNTVLQKLDDLETSNLSRIEAEQLPVWKILNILVRTAATIPEATINQKEKIILQKILERKHPLWSRQALFLLLAIGSDVQGKWLNDIVLESSPEVVYSLQSEQSSWHVQDQLLAAFSTVDHFDNDRAKKFYEQISKIQPDLEKISSSINRNALNAKFVFDMGAITSLSWRHAKDPKESVVKNGGRLGIGRPIPLFPSFGDAMKNARQQRGDELGYARALLGRNFPAQKIEPPSRLLDNQMDEILVRSTIAKYPFSKFANENMDSFNVSGDLYKLLSFEHLNEGILSSAAFMEGIDTLISNQESNQGVKSVAYRFAYHKNRSLTQEAIDDLAAIVGDFHVSGNESQGFRWSGAFDLLVDAAPKHELFQSWEDQIRFNQEPASEFVIWLCRKRRGVADPGEFPKYSYAELWDRRDCEMIFAAMAGAKNGLSDSQGDLRNPRVLGRILVVPLKDQKLAYRTLGWLGALDRIEWEAKKIGPITLK